MSATQKVKSLMAGEPITIGDIQEPRLKGDKRIYKTAIIKVLNENGMSPAEIAIELGISKNIVSNQLISSDLRHSYNPDYSDLKNRLKRKL